ncbi:LysR family transcriptional regulator [Puniceicoccaceae bacterium K14]|nr:LysR family transcriptional regulator [Puniceicoccaceae bacterium K14]
MHQLRYFLAVADEGNFTRAAEKCFISQPSLSSQIIKLEEELGQKLFNRLGRTAELTGAGRVLERRARSILLDVENVQLEIQQGATEAQGLIHVGATPSVAPYLMPQVIANCKKLYPKLEISMHENLRVRLLDDLIAGELDLAIIAITGEHPDISAEPLLEEELYLVVSDSHPLASKTKVSIEDFKDEPLITLGESSTLGRKIMEFFGRNEYEPKVAGTCSQVRTLKEMVDRGLGVAILPKMAIDLSEPFKVVYRSLESNRMNRLLFILTHDKRYHPPGVRAFTDVLREYVDENLD